MASVFRAKPVLVLEGEKSKEEKFMCHIQPEFEIDLRFDFSENVAIDRRAKAQLSTSSTVVTLPSSPVCGETVSCPKREHYWNKSLSRNKQVLVVLSQFNLIITIRP